MSIFGLSTPELELEPELLHTKGQSIIDNAKIRKNFN